MKIFFFPLFLFTIISGGCNTSDISPLSNSLNEDSTLALKSYTLPFNTHLVLQNVKDDSTKFFSDFLQNEQTLYFFFTFNHCDDCIKRVFQFFQNHPDFHQNNVVILAVSENVRPLFVLQSQYNVTYPILRMDSAAEFQNKLFLYNKPFFFKVVDGHLRDIHFINFNLPQRTLSYLNKQ